MPKKLAPEVDALIFAFSKMGFSRRQVQSKLKEQNITVSDKTVSNVLNSIGYRRNHKSVGLSSPKKEQPRTVRTRALIQKIDNLTNKKDPPTQRAMAASLGVSVGTVNNVLCEDLGATARKKRRVHKLNPSHKANRKTNSRKLYEERLAGRNGEFCVTLDEAWFYLQDGSGSRRIYYKKEDQSDPEHPYENAENFGEKIMVVGAFCARGTLPLIKVPRNVKVNSEWYIKHVLRPICEIHIPKLYGGDTNKVFLHHDKASSHTSKKTADYAADLKARLGITIINKEDIPVKSPDTAPMDFFFFGYLKQKLEKRKPKTVAGLWKILNQIWNGIPSQMVTNIMNSWKRRLRAVARGQGEHIENTSAIHRRKL
jgi:hypothetical protein